MAAFLENFQHDLRVFSFEEIKSITGDFDKNNLIGEGGFGKVYKGVVDSDSKGQIMAAFKRLDSNRTGQGDAEFLKEIIMLSLYTHENLISLLGFCDNGREKILVYEHAAHGSLDSHLSSTTLTWTQRLKICLGAAMGLCYLHDPKETHQRIIHRDIKSSNILLDENWNAKVSDMGLSKIGPANQMQSVLATNVAGTFFYIDPEYMETSILTKESDIYSFGVVLFEVLCGSLCFENKNGQFHRLVRMWTKSYKQKKLEEIIFHHLKQGMDPRSLETFSEIAYGCLQKSRAERPDMSLVVEKLEIALHFQQEMEFKKIVKAAVNIEELEMLLSKTIFPKNESSKLELEEIIKAAIKNKELEMLLNERFLNNAISEMEFEEMVEAVANKGELEMLLSKRFDNKEEREFFLSKGILVNGGKTWFKLDKRQHCEIISEDACKYSLRYAEDTPSSVLKSRFNVPKKKVSRVVSAKTHVTTRFLVPGNTYTVNLVLSLKYTWVYYKGLRYQLAGETEFSTSFILHERGDGCSMAYQLCHFICDKENVDLDITFDCDHYLQIEGIEFQSLERISRQITGELEQVLEELEEMDITHPDTYWEQKLPNDWEEIVNWSKDGCVRWTTNKELYSILCKGFLINDNEEWFFLANNGMKCHMLSARKAFRNTSCHWKPLPDSRFGVVACDPVEMFYMNCKSITLSPRTTYGAYLVYKLQENHPRFKSPLEVRLKHNYGGVESIKYYIYLLSRDQPLDISGKVYQKKRVPKRRNDGWMEVPIWEFETSFTVTGPIWKFEGIMNPARQNTTVEFLFTALDNTSLKGLIVEGIEFRPFRKCPDRNQLCYEEITFC